MRSTNRPVYPPKPKATKANTSKAKKPATASSFGSWGFFKGLRDDESLIDVVVFDALLKIGIPLFEGTHDESENKCQDDAD